MVACHRQQYQACPQQTATCQLHYDKGNRSQSTHKEKLQELQTTSEKSFLFHEASQQDSCFKRRTESLQLSSCLFHKLYGSSQYLLALFITQVAAKLFAALSWHAGLHNHSFIFPNAVWQASMACNPDLIDHHGIVTTAGFCSPGDPTGAEKHAFHSLVWFDHWLRTIGPLFPFMLLATRYRLAALAPEVLAFDQQPWVEQIVVYIGLTVTRLAIYFIHRLGKHLNLSCFLTQFLTAKLPRKQMDAENTHTCSSAALSISVRLHAI